MRYRTIVRVIEAFRWQGQPRIDWPVWASVELLAESGSALYAYTHNGPVRVNRGDWCVLGEKEIYPCTDEEFRKRYEELQEPVLRVQSVTASLPTDTPVEVLVEVKE